MKTAGGQRVYLGLGGNLGDRRANLEAALRGLERFPATRLLAVSGLYETPPVGGPGGQQNYYNAACGVETLLTPKEFLAAIHALERELGRNRPGEIRWGPRIIDIDILLWGALILDEEDLIIPHPRLAERAFALVPLAEIAPGAAHPAARATIRELLERIPEKDAGIRRVPV